MILGSATLAFMMGLGADFGGEKILEAYYTDGSTSNIEAGRGILLTAGALTRFPESETFQNFELQTTVGTKWTSTKAATNGNVTWSHWPIEVLAFYRVPESAFRVGGGLAAHLGNKLDGSGDAAVFTATVENATGLVAEVGYALRSSPALVVGVRGTRIRYKAANASSDVDGSAVGMNLTYAWTE